MIRFAWVMAGGGLGAASRYAITLVAARLVGAGFPWGTLIVNWAGCYLVGALFALGERAAWFGPSARLFLMTGFLGGLTTFSTYGLESVNAARSGWLPALANIAAHNIGGLLLVVIGMMTVRMIK